MYSRNIWIFLILGIAFTVTYSFIYNVFSLRQLSFVTALKTNRFLSHHGTFYQGRKVKNWTCKKLEFSSADLPLTALLSTPGSGSTWLRHLLQQATGLLTGSIHQNNTILKRNGFPGEGVDNRSVIVIATNETGAIVRNKYDRGILLVRDPYETILASFDRKHGGPVGYAQEKHFASGWLSFVKEQADKWRNTIEDWLSSGISLHIVEYENLENNLRTELLGVLMFLNITVSHKDMWCVHKNSEGLFKREDRRGPLRDPYTDQMRAIIEPLRLAVYEKLRKSLNRKEEVR